MDYSKIQVVDTDGTRVSGHVVRSLLILAAPVPNGTTYKRSDVLRACVSHAVLGESYNALAKELNCSHNTVGRWVRSFEANLVDAGIRLVRPNPLEQQDDD